MTPMGTFTTRRLVIAWLLAILALSHPISGWAQSAHYGMDVVPEASSRADLGSSSEAFRPAVIATSEESPSARVVDWGGLARDSLLFLALENAFRCATEQGTRDAFSKPFVRGYLNSLGNMHGWHDGDPFYVNYLGHPMQGAISGDIWTHNDRAYRDIEFGRNRRYWKGKLRGGAYSYIYSVLFEIGPASEASIGNVQALYPAQGFVDHVVTPVIGLGWSITEDALDQYLVRRVESRTGNPWIRGLVRSGLNPARSMANTMSLQWVWHRDNRPGVRFYNPKNEELMAALKERNTAPFRVAPPPGVAPFEVTMSPLFRSYIGDDHKGSCAGGGGSAATRLAQQWQFIVDVSGCKLLGLHQNLSGDSLSYLTGVRWTARASARWNPHAELLVGGTKLTQELIYPELKQQVDLIAEQAGSPRPRHSAYSQHWETNGFAIQAGSGVDVKLNNALSIRAVSLAYAHSWTDSLNGINYQNGVQVSTGLVLRMGTW
jgi:hypothetical protein